ncbi:PPOX class F420-dependent oxidoreductase [Streptomyces sp. NBC_01429]|uniref:PPOX class F420-dependent oxidoreductase n=1 Tax=Streptomyces sp. NBC_01429 TaxID=2903862 RepID=UPI002E2E15FB|nr:PPOX class F420-dependent oxidoreductase [Streptomyces sp. NBC_01429]
MTTIEELGRSRYVSITTYRKDGTGVATPVWHAVDGGELFIWTRSDSWKVKRIRNNGKALVTACDARGRIAPGAVGAEGVARLLDAAELGRVRRLIGAKYTWQFWLVDWPAMVVRRGKRPHTGIAVTLDAARPDGSGAPETAA